MDPNNPEKKLSGDSKSSNDEDSRFEADNAAEKKTLETVELNDAYSQSTVEIPAAESDSGEFSISADGKRAAADATIQITDSDATSGSSTPFGIGAPHPDNSKTLPNIEHTIDMGTVNLRPAAHQSRSDVKKGSGRSVMNSSNISQTINPRELSNRDAAFWGSAALDASNANKAEQSKLRPAIERSITESKLQIRQRDLAVPTRAPDAPSDYRLVRLLGRGGMGNVYVARQSSLDRMIAVKVIKPLSKDKRKSLQKSGRLEEVENDRRQQFLSEAVVTGDLDHPNIVPIHDIAVAADNTLFYAMKRVVGEPWLKTIKQKSRDENLEILLKVCDAIAFAHTRGVIHRDIKPENIMLGDFGEVLVMDWGLALAKPEFEKKDSITATAGLGGTPAFMAPEMAIGPVDAIGVHSDVYLLGATLYYFIVGHPPHKAENVSQCIKAVASNKIQSPPEEHQGELLDIAMRAMATRPEDRYQSVKELQNAIRAYRSHSESIAISTAATKEYELATETSRYESFSRASHGFEQAIALWSANQTAIEGLAKCKIDHANAALAIGDYDLGLSLLDRSNPDHSPLAKQLEDGIRLREQRSERLKLFRSLAAAGLFVIIFGGSIAMYVINEKRTEAQRQTEIAQQATNQVNEALVQVNEEKNKVEQQKAIAESEWKRAESEKERAETNEDIAKENAIRAIASENAAKAALELANYESYLSRIGLAKARVDGNEFDDARRILTGIQESAPGQTPAWEWRYLWNLASQSQSSKQFDASVVDLTVATQRGIAIVACSDGSVHGNKLIGPDDPVWTWRNKRANCVAIADDELHLAIGSTDGTITIVDPETGQSVRSYEGHQGEVTDICFLDNTRFLTGSKDRTVALWSTENSQMVAQCWHIGPVTKIAARERDNQSPMMIAAVSDANIGRVVGWTLTADSFIRIGEYLAHDHPVTSVALDADGQLAASGDSRGNVRLWQPSRLERTDYENAIDKAIAKLDDDSDASSSLVSVVGKQNATIASWRAHQDAIGSMQFDRQSGTLLTGSDDYTIRGWSLSDQSFQYSLRGHGGWVRALAIAALPSVEGGRQDRAVVFSGSADRTLRTWISPASQLIAEQSVDRSTDQDAATQASTSLPSARDNQLHFDEILAARLNAQGTRVISASRDHTARILEIDHATMAFRKLTRIQTEDRNSSELTEGTEFLAMSAKIDVPGSRLFVGSADSTIRIWDIESGVELGDLTGTGLNNSFAISNNGRVLVSGSSDADAKAIVWNIDQNERHPRVIKRLQGHEQAVTAFAISHNGDLLVTGDRTGRCIVWDGRTGNQIGDPIDLFRGYRINDLTLSNDESSVWIASDSGQLTEIDLDSGAKQRHLDHEGIVTKFSFAPDQTEVVTLSTITTRDQMITTAKWWDLTTGQSRRLDRVETPLDENGQSTGRSTRITSVDFDGTGERVVICHGSDSRRQGRVSVLNLATGSAKAFELPSSIGAPEVGLLFGTDQLLTLNGDAAFRWSTTSMVHEKSYRSHAAVTNACFTPDGQLAATASRSVRLWDTSTGETVDKLESPHRGAIRSLDAASGKDSGDYLFVTTGDDGIARLWSWKNRKTGFALKRQWQIEGTAVQAVRFAPDGQSLMLALADGTIQIWSIEGESPIVTLTIPSQASVTCAAYSHDGRFLALASDDKSAVLFDLQSESQPLVSVFQGHADRIESICVVQDRSNQLRVMTASRDKSVRVWDPSLETGRELLSLRRHTQGVTAIDCTASGNLVMTAARDGRVLLWPTETSIP